MIGAQRFTHAVLLAEPFAEVDEFAPLRAEGPHGRGEEVVFLLADRATDAGGLGHDRLAESIPFQRGRSEFGFAFAGSNAGLMVSICAFTAVRYSVRRLSSVAASVAMVFARSCCSPASFARSKRCSVFVS